MTQPSQPLDPFLALWSRPRHQLDRVGLQLLPDLLDGCLLAYFVSIEFVNQCIVVLQVCASFHCQTVVFTVNVMVTPQLLSASSSGIGDQFGTIG